MIKLKNKTNQIIQCTLGHNEVCKRLGKCLCKENKPLSIYFTSGELKSVDEAYCFSVDLKKAIANGKIEIVKPKSKQETIEKKPRKARTRKTRSK